MCCPLRGGASGRFGRSTDFVAHRAWHTWFLRKEIGFQKSEIRFPKCYRSVGSFLSQKAIVPHWVWASQVFALLSMGVQGTPMHPYSCQQAQAMLFSKEYEYRNVRRRARFRGREGIGRAPYTPHRHAAEGSDRLQLHIATGWGLHGVSPPDLPQTGGPRRREHYRRVGRGLLYHRTAARAGVRSAERPARAQAVPCAWAVGGGAGGAGSPAHHGDSHNRYWPHA